MASIAGGPYGRFQPSRAGIAALLRGPAVRAWVAGVVAHAANAAAVGSEARLAAIDPERRRELGVDDSPGRPYVGYVKRGRWDTLGVVRTNGARGAVDENQGHSLERLL